MALAPQELQELSRRRLIATTTSRCAVCRLPFIVLPALFDYDPGEVLRLRQGAAE